MRRGPVFDSCFFPVRKESPLSGRELLEYVLSSRAVAFFSAFISSCLPF